MVHRLVGIGTVPTNVAIFRSILIPAWGVGKKVREAREARGWTQTELANRAGMKQHAISRFEAGDSVPTLQTLDRIAVALDVHLRIELASA